MEAKLLHQYKQKIGLYGSMTVSEPKAVSAGMGVQWTGKKNWTTFGIYAGADENRGVPMAALLRGHWHLWKGLFLELEDIIVCRTYKQHDLGVVVDGSGNVIDQYGTENLVISLHQQQELFLGVSF